MSPSIDTTYVENEEISGGILSEDSEYGSMTGSAVLPEVVFTSTHLNTSTNGYPCWIQKRSFDGALYLSLDCIKPPHLV